MTNIVKVPDFSRYKDVMFCKGRQIAVSMPEPLAVKIEARAASEFLTKSAWIRKAILMRLNEEDTSHG